MYLQVFQESNLEKSTLPSFDGTISPIFLCITLGFHYISIDESVIFYIRLNQKNFMNWKRRYANISYMYCNCTVACSTIYTYVARQVSLLESVPKKNVIISYCIVPNKLCLYYYTKVNIFELGILLNKQSSYTLWLQTKVHLEKRLILLYMQNLSSSPCNFFYSVESIHVKLAFIPSSYSWFIF